MWVYIQSLYIICTYMQKRSFNQEFYYDGKSFLFRTKQVFLVSGKMANHYEILIHWKEFVSFESGCPLSVTQSSHQDLFHSFHIDSVFQFEHLIELYIGLKSFLGNLSFNMSWGNEAFRIRWTKDISVRCISRLSKPAQYIFHWFKSFR